MAKNTLTLRDLKEAMMQPGPGTTMQVEATIPARIVVTEGMTGSAFLKGEFVLFVPPEAVTKLSE